MRSELGHSIKHRKVPNDNFVTPELLVRNLVRLVPFEPGDMVLDPAFGTGAFYRNFPDYVKKDWCEASFGKDFLKYIEPVEWIVTNPPYSNLDVWWNHTTLLAGKGFAFLLGFTNITPRRIEMANKAGFGLTQIHLCKVFEWYGISAFCVFEVGKENIVSYDRIVWM